jgi:hypothetical protein
MDHGHRCGAVGAFLYGCLELRIMVGKLRSFTHGRHAVMPSISAAAGRQVRLTRCGQRKEWRDERQAEHGQQKNGKKSTHWFD